MEQQSFQWYPVRPRIFNIWQIDPVWLTIKFLVQKVAKCPVMRNNCNFIVLLSIRSQNLCYLSASISQLFVPLHKCSRAHHLTYRRLLLIKSTVRMFVHPCTQNLPVSAGVNIVNFPMVLKFGHSRKVKRFKPQHFVTNWTAQIATITEWFSKFWHHYKGDAKLPKHYLCSLECSIKRRN